jgi:hypothetical protein
MSDNSWMVVVFVGLPGLWVLGMWRLHRWLEAA